MPTAADISGRVAFRTELLLEADGFRPATTVWDGTRLTRSDSPEQDGLPDPLLGYFAPGLPVDVHCHGMGPEDFSDFTSLDLRALDAVAAREGTACIPTLYLHRDRLADFVAFMRQYAAMRADGLLPHIPGVALEGPLLSSHGGTPAATVWPPTRQEWETLAACGSLGLLYTVISPDAFTPASGLQGCYQPDQADLGWIVTTLVQHGVRPALGHFTRQDPSLSARLIHEMVDAAWSVDTPLHGARVVTDHLFNDMPLTIRHAFRTHRAREQRAALIESYDLPGWNLADLDEQVGPVPAAIMRLCQAGRVASCLNFDGEHVDLAIAARAVEIVGSRNIMLMTDRCDSARLGGQQLAQSGENSLWYQDAGIVAAGSQPIDRQISNARSAGLAEQDIWNLVSSTALRSFGLLQDQDTGPAGGCFILPDGNGALNRFALTPAYQGSGA
ncbi:hypothetical protein ACFC6L_20345 [Kitasatospora phosalacinea]|uniref:hypothetical protein n=1 Tax=Kitasatospora phosalacinea TaxID=2065 RepID=UPI0035DD5D2A